MSAPTGSAGAHGPRVGDRHELLFDLLPLVLEEWRQDQLLAQCAGVLIDRESWAERRDLEQHTAGLAEIDRTEPEAVDDWSRPRAMLDHLIAPALVVVHLGGPGDVVDSAGALDPGL